MGDLPTVGIGLTAGGLEAARRVLGPALDEVGEAVRRWTAYRLGNVERVLVNAADKTEDADGVVNPRVAMRVLDDASFSDDQIVVDYLGGVLASAHTPVGRDDRGVMWSNLVSNMSSYELRTHYLIYREVRQLLEGEEVNWGDGNEAERHRIYIPTTDYMRGMGFTNGEDAGIILGHVFHALHHHGLIGQHRWQWSANPEKLSNAPGVEEGGITCYPSQLGVELFLWGQGHGREPAERLTDPELSLDFAADLPDMPGAELCSVLRERAAERRRAEQEAARKRAEEERAELEGEQPGG